MRFQQCRQTPGGKPIATEQWSNIDGLGPLMDRVKSALVKSSNSFFDHWGSRAHLQAIEIRDDTDGEFAKEAMVPSQVLYLDGVRRLRQAVREAASALPDQYAAMAGLGTDAGLLQCNADLVPVLDQAETEADAPLDHQAAVRRRVERRLQSMSKELPGLSVPEVKRDRFSSSEWQLGEAVDEMVRQLLTDWQPQRPVKMTIKAAAGFVGMNPQRLQRLIADPSYNFRATPVEGDPDARYLFDLDRLEFHRQVQLDRNRFEVLTVVDAAAYVGVSDRTIRNWIKEDPPRLNAEPVETGVRGRYYFDRQQLDRQREIRRSRNKQS